MTSPFVPGSSIRIEGRPGGPLAGLTFAAKDLFDVAGTPTGGGNPDWARQNPIPTRHAWAVHTLLDAGATLVGNGPDALTRVTMIGNDMGLDPGVGTCGKEGQSVPVGVGQPTLRIDGLTVGGTA